MINELGYLYRYVGPVLWGLLPISVISQTLVIYVLCSIFTKRKISDWIEVILAYAKETASILGLLGSVYALSVSFRLDNATAEEIRQRMFFILSTGFWSTIAGIFISLEASFGLLVMKRT